MGHHLHFYYNTEFDDLNSLLFHMLQVLQGYMPAHIAVGVLNNETHVYMEIETELKIVSLRQAFFDYKECKPTHLKRIYSIMTFKKIFQTIQNVFLNTSKLSTSNMFVKTVELQVMSARK